MAVLDVTTVDRVKARRGLEDDADDALIAALVTAVSQDLETRIGRRVLIGDHVDLIPGWGRVSWVSLPGTVLSAVSAVRVAHEPPDGSEDALETDLYRIAAEECQVWIAPTSLRDDGWHVRIDWTGGMAATTTDFLTDYPELADAADVECVNRLVTRKSPGASRTKVGPSEIVVDEGYQVHRVYREACARWRFRSL